MIRVTVTGDGEGVAALATFIHHAILHHSGLDDVMVDYEGPKKTTTRFGMPRLVVDPITVEAKVNES